MYNTLINHHIQVKQQIRSNNKLFKEYELKVALLLYRKLPSPITHRNNKSLAFPKTLDTWHESEQVVSLGIKLK